ncbi:MAG: bifunctional 5,10-methylenetetrahydrofolate dehydrogenase/5,10-methenyltetrahydrofolate cyclohydrolase, partial [Patescibacteria group bacterium]
GNNLSSERVLRQKENTAQELGLKFKLYRFAEDTTEGEVIQKMKYLGNDERVGGVLVQLPLPARFNRDKILAALNPAKDIDALIAPADLESLPVIVIKAILETVFWNIENLTVVVVGRGFLVGAPIISWLNGKCRELIVCHSKSGLSEVSRADLVISGVGKASLIKPAALKAGAGVIDFGYDRIDGKVRGDLDVSDPELSKLGFYTPTPGGTGPILVAALFQNFYQLCSLSATKNKQRT